MNNTNIKNFNVDNFSAALQEQDKYLLIYFSAPWCQPCKNVRPVFTKFANENIANNVGFGAIDIAISPTIAQKYGIKSVPSIAIFHQNRVVKIISGEVDLQQLELFFTDSICRTNC